MFRTQLATVRGFWRESSACSLDQWRFACPTAPGMVLLACAMAWLNGPLPFFNCLSLSFCLSSFSFPRPMHLLPAMLLLVVTSHRLLCSLSRHSKPFVLLLLLRSVFLCRRLLRFSAFFHISSLTRILTPSQCSLVVQHALSSSCACAEDALLPCTFFSSVNHFAYRPLFLLFSPCSSCLFS